MGNQVQYEALHSNGGDEDFSVLDTQQEHYLIHDRQPPWRTGLRALLVAVITLVVGLSCFFLGRYVERSEVASEWFYFPGAIETEFIYQKPFALAPGNESDAYWQGLFPEGRGFVQHPEIAPEPMGLSEKDSLRRGYWGADHGAPHGGHEASSHIRHCIDYIRQSIMCHADTNLEPVNFELGGVTGFNSTRRYRNMDKVKEWAERWTARL
ncbi:hypothetical protein O1611_g2926 [Lasiodiplodia mahajangana]|uniref:Uncharacterized protein n=1 Tax=Lasiodiplodia mahajangana TaxID=1108764 RepID=A0ACC2JT65_9PEZI|nr:hypothetical protein O1611_g2926 [Lasiodiplodia mahajangana]